MASMMFNIGYIFFLQIISGFKLFHIILLLLFSQIMPGFQINQMILGFQFSQLIDQMIASERSDR